AVVAAVADGSGHPGDAKRRLGRAIADLYHGAGAGERAEAAFDAVFRRGEIPDDIPEHLLPVGSPVHLPGVLTSAGLTASNGEARRHLAAGAVRVDGEVINDVDVDRERLAGR